MKLSLVTESSMNMSYCIVSNAVLSKMHIYGYESEESRDYFLDPNLLETALSKEYSSLEEFYKSLHEKL